MTFQWIGQLIWWPQLWIKRLRKGGPNGKLAHLKCPSILLLQPHIPKTHRNTWAQGPRPIYIFVLLQCPASDAFHLWYIYPHFLTPRLHPVVRFVSILSVACHSNGFYFAFMCPPQTFFPTLLSFSSAAGWLWHVLMHWPQCLLQPASWDWSYTVKKYYYCIFT